MSRERMTGRILIVWEDTVGTVLTADAAAGATVLYVDDVAPFNGATNDDGPGGWLQVGDQVVQYTGIDDDASTITLASGLASAVTVGSETGDVLVWNDLYGEPDTIQWAEVKPSGKRNQADTIEAVVADSIDGLSNGDRGQPGEFCTLVRDGDEWELTAVRGRPSRTKGVRFEANDVYALTAADITAGTATVPLSQRPIDESIDARWTTVPQEPTEYTVDYAAQSITWPLEGFEMAGDRLWVHYEYRVGVVTGAALSLYLEYRAPATGDSHQLVLALPDGSTYTSPVISNSTTFPQLIDLGAIGDPGSVGVTLRNVTRGTQYTYPNAAAFSTESVSGAGWSGIRYKCEDQPGGLGDNGQYSDLWFQIRGATK